MYYYKRGEYKLNRQQQLLFGLDRVSARFDQLGNGIVINSPENQLLAGDRIRSRRNPNFNPQEPISNENQQLLYSLTDDYNALLSARLAELRQSDESQTMQSRIGILAIVGAQFPKLNQEKPSETVRYEQAIGSILHEDRYVLNLSKQQAKMDLELVIEKLRNRFETPKNLGALIMRAAQHYRQRERQLVGSADASRQRQSSLQREFAGDKIARNSLAAMSDQYRIDKAPTLFKQMASTRQSKPGNLTVSNAWFHRGDENAWKQMVLAQDGWEALYGPMMRPLSMLSNESIVGLSMNQDVKVGHYALLLSSLEDVIDLSMIGGDYDRLAWQLQNQLFKVEELLLNGVTNEKFFRDAIKAARDYRFLLRYRTLPGSPPPQEWYGGLAGIHPQDKGYSTPDNPFEGLSYP